MVQPLRLPPVFIHVLNFNNCTYIYTMNTKLTLSINKAVTERAKKYARRKKTSLSKLVESQLAKLTSDSGEDTISPLVKSLSGVLSGKKAASAKNDYATFLKKKYK